MNYWSRRAKNLKEKKEMDKETEFTYVCNQRPQKHGSVVVMAS